VAKETSDRTYIFLVKRGTSVNEQILEQVDNGKVVGKDLTDAKWKVYFRCWEQDGTFLQNFELTKASPATSGYVSGYVPAFAAARALLHCEIALVDTSVVDATTPSGKKEPALKGMRWDTAVKVSET
jgi:hypothetical protein